MFQNGKSSGNLDVQLLLGIRNMDLISVSKDPQGSLKETRTKAPNKILNEEDQNTTLQTTPLEESKPQRPRN